MLYLIYEPKNPLNKIQFMICFGTGVPSSGSLSDKRNEKYKPNTLV